MYYKITISFVVEECKNSYGQGFPRFVDKRRRGEIGSRLVGQDKSAFARAIMVRYGVSDHFPRSNEYMEVSFDAKEYTQLIIFDNTTLKRRLIGLEGAPDSPLMESSVQEQLKRQAINSGLFDANGDVYVSGNAIYMLMK